jgi:predicted Zn finger-like uncharacterized protein
MKITCPHCGLSGRISDEKLKASSGNVRCPRCRKTFTPTAEFPSGVEIPSRPPGPLPKTKRTKREDVIVGTRSGDDVPFTRVMADADAQTIPDGDLLVEIEGIDLKEEIPQTESSDEIISLGEEDIVSEEGPPFVDIGAEIPEVGTEGEAEPAAPPARPASKGFFSLLSAIKKPKTAVEPEPALAPVKKGKRGIRGGFILILFSVLVLWGGYWFFSTYWPPYEKEKDFLTDSRVLFDKYHELMVYLKVGLPDPVFSTKVAEAAYIYEVYNEKHEALYAEDPLFVSLTVTGRLFLAVKELLDRDMAPNNFLGLEWGEGFPFVTKEEYVNALVEGIPLCITTAEKNFQFSKEMLDAATDFNFVSMTLASVTNGPRESDRRRYAVELKKINKVFAGLNSSMPVLEKTIVDVRNMMKSLP